jgi:hypothetical protein
MDECKSSCIYGLDKPMPLEQKRHTTDIRHGMRVWLTLHLGFRDIPPEYRITRADINTAPVVWFKVGGGEDVLEYED